MGKISRFKRALACAVSAATLFSCASVNVANYSTVVAADGQNYAEALAMSLYFFDANQCGTEVDDNPLTWRGNCHTYDAKAELSKATNFDSQYKSLVDPDGDGLVDVSGGYHDAGDHVKFNLTNAFAGSSLAMSYYLNDGAYAKAGCEDHLFDILKNISDYLMKTTFLNSDGSVATICYNVSDDSDHSYWQSPEVQTYERKTYWMTSSKNNSAVCGQMASALAGSAYVLKKVAPEYSEKCLKYAKAIYEFGTKYSGNENSGMGSMYGTDSEARDDLGLAAIWLYLNDSGSLPSYKPTQNGCYDYSMYDYHYYCWNKVWSGYATMMYKITKDQAYANEMLFELNNKGGVPTDKYNATDQGQWGGSRYNCALQMVALGLANGDASSQYAQGAKYQMDYLLGNNKIGYSFLVGYGENWPVHIHHRAANPGDGDPQKNPTAKYTNYGMLIGGPSDSNGTYQDHANQYQYTEPALDYNACFALACAGLLNLYGGDASDLDSIVKNAEEIKSDYEFGKWYKGDQPVVTTTVTTEPTETTTTTVVTTVTTTETTEPTEETTASETSTTPETSVTTTETTETTSENPVQPTKYGDIDCDDIITATDIVLLNKYILSSTEYDLKPVAKANADCNNDGVIDLKDSNMLIGVVIGTFSENDLGKAVN